MIIKWLNKIALKWDYTIAKKQSSIPADVLGDIEFCTLYEQCKNYTMTSAERMYSLYQAMKYIFINKIEGDFVECGVWKGGSSMMIALMLKKYNMPERKLYLFDTYEGMSEPTDADKTSTGKQANELLMKEDKADPSSIWCYDSLENVRQNLLSTGFPEKNIFFIKGKVEDTLENNLPGKLSLLRLDTDWYESTKIELELLYPLLIEKGVMIIDDFGHWEGAKKAVIEYFEQINLNPFLFRIDYTGRLMIKTTL